jgi:hypothetical protein
MMASTIRSTTITRAVVDVARGDTNAIQFDFLLRMHDETCIGIEVVRAKDQEQVRSIERGARQRDPVITGTAEMPWDSLRVAIDKKLAKTDRYREALRRLCRESQLHLGVTSALQQLHFDGAVGAHIEDIARGALSGFDAVWLVQGGTILRLER